MAKAMKSSKSSKSTTKQSPINLNPANAGKLRSTLGIKKGGKVPVAALVKATKSPNKLTRQRAQFALNLNHPAAAKKAAKTTKSSSKSK